MTVLFPNGEEGGEAASVDWKAPGHSRSLQSIGASRVNLADQHPARLCPELRSDVQYSYMDEQRGTCHGG